MKRSIITALLVLSMLAGCATAYQPLGMTGGYSDSQVSDDEFIVQFDGNAHTDQSKAVQFTLMRCADVCLNHGYGYFKIIEDRFETNVSYRQHPGSATTFGSFRKGRYSSSTIYTPPSVTEFRRPTVQARIRCYVNPPEGEVLGNTAFDARHIQALGKKKFGP